LSKLIDENVLKEINECLIRLIDLLDEDLDRALDGEDADWEESLTTELSEVVALQKLLRETTAA
jgi:hypothetical protein